MDLGELEALAISLYSDLGISPDEPPRAELLARAWLDHRHAVVRRHLVATPSARQRFDGKVTVVVRPSVPEGYLPWYICHELGHELLDRVGYVGEDVEACADYIGAALVLPAACVSAVYRAEGFAPRVLAELSGGTQTLGVLRFGEVRRIPLVAVAQVIRVRGPENFVWPEEETLRTWARARRVRPGLRKIAITDQRGRVALVADEDVSETG